MVSIWSAIVFALGLAAFAILLNHVDPGQPRRWTRALIGLAPGLVGAVLVGTLITDLVPDGLEATITPWVVAIATVVVVGLTVMNLARR
jgi:predicted membrane channel-forming protein YqfA (hemolysin III family)